MYIFIRCTSNLYIIRYISFADIYHERYISRIQSLDSHRELLRQIELINTIFHTTIHIKWKRCNRSSEKGREIKQMAEVPWDIPSAL